MHGHGGRADEFFAPAPVFADGNVIYATAQAPYALPAAGRIGFSWTLRGVDNEAGDQGARELSMRYVLNVVDTLTERYNVADVYLMGFSQGGTVTYRTAIANPTRFAGLLAFGSGFDPDWFADGELEAASRLRVFVGHGRADRRAELSRLARDTFRDLEYDVTLYDYEGGHTIDMSAIDELLEWIDAGGGSR